jgi:hypothetical protein
VHQVIHRAELVELSGQRWRMGHLVIIVLSSQVRERGRVRERGEV